MRAFAATAAALVLLAGCTSSGPATTSSTPAPDTTGAATSSAAPSTPAPTTAPPPVRPKTVTILGSGDVLIHPQLWQQAHADAVAAGGTGYDFGPMYASIAPDVRRADLATCEMESPLAPPSGPFTGWPTFDSPPQVLSALTGVGYDSCTTASNHTIDYGIDGVRRTLDELDQAGLKHTGSARSAAEAATPLIETMPYGVKVAQLAYSFGFNGLQLPAGEPWLANLTDIPTILAAARRAKQAGADIVVLSMHWGVEYNNGATDEQKQQAEQLLASPDIDLILGDHPHVVEPAQRLHGKWVFYSMGNQISRHADPILVSREGAMPLVTFAEQNGHWRATRAEVVPTLMQLGPPLRLIDLRLAVRTAPATEKQAYQASIEHVRSTLDAYGAAKDGLIIP
jgi:poly-gamma-glutamate synthesis protein (capsule biosynthesis protein)